MKLPARPRTSEEVAFFADQTPCERCGRRGVKDEEPRYATGAYLAVCATCLSDRHFTFEPPFTRASAPPFHLTPDAAPTALFSAAQLREIVTHELESVPREPTEISTLALYDEARIHLVKARIALNELAKFHPGDAALRRELADAAALWEAYKAAKVVVESKPGALPAPRSLGERFAHHARWLARGKEGDGQLVLRHEVWRHTSMSSEKLRAARIEDSTFDGIDLSFTQLDDAFIRASRFLACDLNMAQLDRATIEHSDFCGSAFGMASLRDTKVTGGDWREIAAGRSTWSAQLTGVDLRGARFRDAVLDDAVFDRCDMRGADFSRKDAILVSLGTARRTRLVECDLRGANVEGWRLDGAVFERCLMHGLEGTPVFEGAVQVVAADLSPDGDRSVLGASWPGLGDAPAAIQELRASVAQAGIPELMPLDLSYESLDRLEDYLRLVLEERLPAERSVVLDRASAYVTATLARQAGDVPAVVSGQFEPADVVRELQPSHVGTVRDRIERVDVAFQRRRLNELVEDLDATLLGLRADVKALTGKDPGALDGSRANLVAVGKALVAAEERDDVPREQLRRLSRGAIVYLGSLVQKRAGGEWSVQESARDIRLGWWKLGSWYPETVVNDVENDEGWLADAVERQVEKRKRS